MKRFLLIPAAYLLAACVVVYVCDYAALRFGILNHRPQIGSVMVQRAWVIPMKDGKTQYAFDPPAPQECVNSLFPHFGDSPCWYLRKHPLQQINTGLK